MKTGRSNLGLFCVPMSLLWGTKHKCVTIHGFVIEKHLISKYLYTHQTTFGPRQANLVLIAYASSEGSGEPAQNLRCSLIQAVSQEEPSDRKPDPWPL